MVLFLHNRYRTTGGEERVVEDLLAVVRKQMGEPAQLLTRDSSQAGAARAAAGLLRGGLGARDVAKAVRLTGATVVHAHNLNPLFGWRALAAAREEGARVVLHLHQYRLVCANGVCFIEGRECTRCHGRNTLPGVIHNCRDSRAEALAYGISLALWQRRMIEQADAVIVPSVFARERLRELGAPLDWKRVHVLAPPVGTAEGTIGTAAGRVETAAGRVETAAGVEGTAGEIAVGVGGTAGVQGVAGVESTFPMGGYALVVSRLAPEKGIDVAIEACRRARVPLVVAGDGPQRDGLRAYARGARAPPKCNTHTHTSDKCRCRQPWPLRVGKRPPCLWGRKTARCIFSAASTTSRLSGSAETPHSRSSLHARLRLSGWQLPRRWPPACLS